ncbi:MAG: signal peptide peptidase SppA [Salinarimonadaceae bacterium]|nr:MAG: signal peptide peptidase SppA [Salinarimonadaceae bacterium]
MANNAEMIADRRRLRRKLSFWRVFAFVALIAVVAVTGWRVLGPDASTRSAHVARVEIGGVIMSDRATTQMLKRIGESTAVRGVVVAINSPGGTVTGSEQLHRALRDLSEKKPVVAFVEGTGASGAYIAAIAADHIVARETAIIGSIGTMFQVPNFNELMQSVGVSVIEVKSSPLKAAPSATGPVDPAGVDALQVVVDDTYAWFRDLVGARRSLSGAALAEVADGRVHSGKRAVSLGLVDELGGEEAAIGWLERERGTPADLPVRRWRPERERSALGLLDIAAGLADAVGLSKPAALLRMLDAQTARPMLDGLLALWQPVLEN